MESAKVVNKILLSSLAFGATFGIGMLVKDDNIQKALMGTGAVGSMACVAGAIVTNNKKDSHNNQDNSLSDSQISELCSQEVQLQQSLNETTAKMQAVEADINSLQNEHDQLLSIISNLSEQKQQLETESDRWNQQIQSKKQQLETENDNYHQQIQSKKQQLETVNTQLSTSQRYQEELNENISTLENQKHDLHKEVEKLSSKQKQLEQVISPIEESVANFDLKTNVESSTKIESETESRAEVEQLVDSLDESELEVFSTELETESESDTNPFINDTLEETDTNKDEQNSELKTVEKLIGSFSESELEMFDHKSPTEVEHTNQLNTIENIIEEESSEPEVEDLVNSINETELEILSNQVSQEVSENSKSLKSESQEMAIAFDEDNEASSPTFSIEDSSTQELQDLMGELITPEGEASEEFSIEDTSTPEELIVEEDETSEAFSLETTPTSESQELMMG
nr:hypothetical protein [Pleurocapsa sp. MO_226.B13]